jgi:hypothetical protein
VGADIDSSITHTISVPGETGEDKALAIARASTTLGSEPDDPDRLAERRPILIPI